MQNRNVTKTTPIPTVKSRRRDIWTGLTSGDAGFMLPIAYAPLLREDSVRSGQYQVSAEMMETVELLANGVNFSLKAYLVPFLAFDRFNGMDALNRSYQKIEETDGGGDVINFIDTALAGAHGSNAIHKTLGLHARPDQTINTAIVEAYNTIWNFRAVNRSQNITKRELNETTLAPAFWQHEQLQWVVPDFDQALVDGEVPLNIVGQRMNISGLGVQENATPTVSNAAQKMADKTIQPAGVSGYKLDSNTAAVDGVRINSDVNGYPDVWAELEENGITVSLSNIDLAKQTAAFARLRQKYQGLDDEYIVDLLMQGISVPEQSLRQPILLASTNVKFGYAQRFATDGDNLDKKVAAGATAASLRVRVPPVNTGGLIMIVAEITPEQLFERQKDWYLSGLDQDEYPNFLKDYLDPEKVTVVPNEGVDVDHTDPTATFGYAPLNYQWQRNAPRVGGKYFRPEVDDPLNEDRMKIWSVETVDPVLTEDFYLCKDMHHNIFADTISDHFEIQCRGLLEIVGNTVFGPVLMESSDDYETILAMVDQERIDKPASVSAAEE